VTVALIAMNSAACNRSGDASEALGSDGAAAGLIAEPLELNLGRQDWNSRVPFSISLANAAADDIVIEAVIPSCGCTVIDGGATPRPDREIPKALAAAIMSRKQLRTGRIKWFEHRYEVAGQQESTGPASTAWYFTGQWAGDEFATTFLGDAEGVRFRLPDGTPWRRAGGGPHHVLHHAGKTWTLDEGIPNVDLAPRIRGRGFAGQHPRDIGLGDSFEHISPVDTRFLQERESESIYRVDVIRDKSRVSYWIDSDRGWSPVRVEYRIDDHLVAASDISLEQYDAVWFPATVCVKRTLPDDRTKLLVMMRLRVTELEINHRDHPRGLSPESIGIDVGFTVHDSASSDVMVWGGEQYGVVTQARYARLVKAGRISDGPKKRAIARKWKVYEHLVPNALAEDRTDRWMWSMRWKRDVEQFTRQNGLKPPQGDQAQSVLRHCLQRALNLHDRNQDEFARLLARADAIYMAASAGESPPNTEEEIRAIQRERDDLMAPIHSIHDNELIPRLESLLTDDQRARAARANQPRESTRR
jgi:hypothetical protein